MGLFEDYQSGGLFDIWVWGAKAGIQSIHKWRHEKMGQF